MAGLISLREVLRKYGAFRTHRQPYFRGVGVSTFIRVCFRGSFAESRMAKMLRVLFVVPPQMVALQAFRRLGRPRPRGGLRLEWYGPSAKRLLDAVGWRVGKPKFDAQALAWRRWLRYKEAARGASKVPAGTRPGVRQIRPSVAEIRTGLHGRKQPHGPRRLVRR